MSEAAAEVVQMPTSERLSVLSQLGNRREEIKKSAVTVLQVPRWTDPVIKVTYKPVDHAIIQRGQDQLEKARKSGKRSEAVVTANIDVLVAGCVSVFAVIDGEEYSLNPDDPEGEHTGFDADLARNLKCGPTARDVVKALYIFDGDIISTAGSIAEFSGYKEQEADEEFVGES